MPDGGSAAGYVLVVEADPAWSQFMAHCIGGVAPVRLADDGAAARSIVSSEDALLALVLEPCLPDITDAAKLLADLRCARAELDLLVVSRLDDLDIVNAAFRFGARLLRKTEDPEQLRTEIVSYVVSASHGACRIRERTERFIERYALTGPEAHVVRLVMRGYRRKELPDACGVSENTMKTRQA